MRSAWVAGAAAAIVAVCAIIIGPAAAQYGGSRCLVADPTGTPLNVREWPEGPVLGTLSNGTYVRLVDLAYDGQRRPWGMIVGWSSGRPLGWVFREYISCY